MVVTIFAYEARSLGFTPRRSVWFRNRGELVDLMQLQKSRFGPIYYLNLGIVARALTDAEPKKILDSHLESRADKFLADIDEWMAACDDSTALTDTERSEVLRKALWGPVDRGFKMFESCQDLLAYSSAKTFKHWIPAADLYRAAR